MVIPKKTSDLFKLLLKNLAPPEKLTVSEWADKNRKLSRESSAEPGQWQTKRTPYLKEPMDAFTDPEIEKVVVMFCSQAGKSELVNNIAGYIIDVDPGPMIMIQPSLELAEGYSLQRIGPMIRDTKCLSEHIVKDNALYKEFAGGYFVLAGANSPGGLAGRPIRTVLADEIDRFPASAGNEGDPLKLVEQRTITFWNRKFIYVSTPTIKDASRIFLEYERGTQEKWSVACPSCGTFEYINLHGMLYGSLVNEADKTHRVSDVVYQCSHCLAKHTEYEWKRQPGTWIANNPEAKKTRSFHINAFVSPWTKWNLLLEEYLDSKHDPELLKVFTNTKLGETFEQKGTIEDETYLLDRKEDYGAELPDDVAVLTMGVDVQGNRLEYEVVGWGLKEESWSIEYGVLMGDPSKSTVWESLLDVIQKKWKFADGLGYNIGVTFIDSGGHHTTEVYEFTKRYEASRVFAIKGMGGPGYPIIHKLSKTAKENASLIILGVDSGKSTIIQRLQVKTPGPGYMHFPNDPRYDQQYFKGLISEKQVRKKTGGQWKVYWEKTGITQRNEPFDVRNYAYAAYKMWNPNIEAFKNRLAKLRGKSVVSNEPIKKKKQRRGGVVRKGI